MSGRNFGKPYNDELRSLMEAHNLDRHDVAAHLDVEYETVKAWLKPKTSRIKCPKIRVDTLKVILKLKLADLTDSQRERVVDILKGA